MMMSVAARACSHMLPSSQHGSQPLLKLIPHLTFEHDKRQFWCGRVKLGRHSPGQHKRIKEHSQQYDDKWSTDLDAWTDRNNMVYPPLDPALGVRPAEVHHGRRNVRYSAKRFYQATRLVRNMNIDEALERSKLMKTKGGDVIHDVLLEAQEMAVRDHNVEYKSNLHVVASFAQQCGIIKFPIYHGRGRVKIGSMRFSNYFVRLREGPAPPPKPRLTALEFAYEYLDHLRSRTIKDGL